ncbi:hypothetical protein EXIGLDRAFT_783580 [Exidia glandulosa HHB12029]|uniref:Uncharacterized protein n=1 Tax=Exidia glandulosa HHB12029 TaxID=1314781 RepID=A0A166MZN0_EXIGL|nr:hypothetical protein EXIGLDRAFT_783580 [Exidia glandulosa HHB12029]
MELDDADKAALADLIGTENMREGLTSDAGREDTQGSADTSTTRRTSSTRIAAAEAAREGKRRKVAHVLVRNFKFLDHPGAVSALKLRTDDYVSTVSWAADEQSRLSKPGMQGKSSAGLRKIVDEMNKIAADSQTTNTDTVLAVPNA